jgi:hypothetical protein
VISSDTSSPSRAISTRKAENNHSVSSAAAAAAVTTSSPSPSTRLPRYSAPTYHIINDQEADENERRATVLEQDLDFEVSLRSDRTQKLLQEEREAEFNRLVDQYTQVSAEPALSEPEAITVVFKISDEVYAKRTNAATTNSVLDPKHKKMSRRFLSSDSVQNLFSFLFCHLYQFQDHEEKYVGRPVSPLFTPGVHCGGDAPFHQRNDFLSFDLICSYPKVVLRSSTLFFKDIFDEEDTSSLTIQDLGIKNNTLLSLRPSN